MADIELIVKISEDSYKATCNGWMLPPDVENVVKGIKNGTPLQPQPCEDCISRAETMTEIMMFAGNVKLNEEDIYIKVSDAVQLLRELPPVTPKPKTEWIPVSERLPEDHENVLIYLSSNQVTIGLYNSHRLPFMDKPLGWGADAPHGWSSDEVVAWMPLPTPYEPQESEG